MYISPQSIGAEKKEAVTHRGLTLQELLGQLSHYNEHVRKSAVQGIAESVKLNGLKDAVIGGKVLRSILCLLTDPSAPVRAVLPSASDVILKSLASMAGEDGTVMGEEATALLRVGLSHVDAAVRVASLGVLDHMLMHSPRSLAPCFNQACAPFLVTLVALF